MMWPDARLVPLGMLATLCLTLQTAEAGVTSRAPQAGSSDKTAIRETSPLRAIAVPYDFKQTIETADERAKEPDPEDELAERQRISEEAKWLYITSNDGDLDKLEALLARYRNTKERTLSGVWKLTQAYGFLRHLETDWTRKRDPNWPDNDKEHFDKWTAKYPQSPAPHIFRAAIKNYRATAILRDRLARSTYEGGIPALQAQIKQAREDLQAVKDIASKDPYYYALMIMLMRNEGAGADEIMHVALESSDRYPDFFDAYFEATKAIGSLSRKPHDDVETLANTAFERTKATLGDEIYARIYWNATQTIFGLGELPGLKWNWQRMKSSMETVATRYPVQWNIQNFAMFSCVMRDISATRSFISRSRGIPLATVWSQSEFFDACREFAEAAAPPTQPETRKANAP